MPIYEYKCDKCEEQFEVMQRISDDPLTTCAEAQTLKGEKPEKCCKGKLKKMISQTSFSLKGGGWYKDGYS